MPTVQTYGPPKVRTEAIPGVRKQAAETPLSTGVGLERAKIGTAEAWGQVGQTIEQIGHGFARNALEEKQKAEEFADQVAILEADNQLALWEHQTLYDPEKGALTIKGKSAMGLPEKVYGDYQQVAGTIGQGLTTDKQRLAFAKIVANRGESIDATLRRYTNEQMTVYAAKELQATRDNALSDGVSNATDPRRVGMALNRAVDAINGLAPKLGLGPEQVQQQVDETTTAMHVGVIQSLLAQDKTSAANVYFDETKSQIKGAALEHITTALQGASTATTGLSTAEALWAQHGPKTDVDPINLDAMETAARAQFKDKPKELEATLHFLRERKAGVDASRKDREEANTGELWIKASEGATLDQLRRLPAFINAPGKLQAQLSDYIVGKAEHEASRAYAEEGRAYTRTLRAEAEESRAYTREQRAEKAKEQRGWARYWDLSDPKVLDAATENQLQALRGELGDEHVNRLLTQKRSLAKSEDTVRAASIDDDLFKTTAASAGLKPYDSKLTEDQRSELGQLKNAVETAIDVEQRRTGKALTREQKQTIMRGITDQHVMLNVWGSDPERVAATVVNPDERAKAYVPLAKIPDVAIGQYLNYARGLSRALQQMPDVELRARFADRIQRAYALRLLGGTRAEIEAALKGAP